jgi:hypothetical protein
MPAERQIAVMLERVRPLLGVHPDIMRDYLYYRSEVELQRDRLDRAEQKAVQRFDRFLQKYKTWIVREVYTPELLAEAREEFEPNHWWWYFS